MRIATWNLERATGREKNSRRLDLIASIEADIWVLTETDDAIDLAPLGHHPVRSEHDAAAQPGERWVTIWSRFPITKAITTDEPSAPRPRSSTALVGPLIVIGTALLLRTPTVGHVATHPL